MQCQSTTVDSLNTMLAGMSWAFCMFGVQLDCEMGVELQNNHELYEDDRAVTT